VFEIKRAGRLDGTKGTRIRDSKKTTSVKGMEMKVRRNRTRRRKERMNVQKRRQESQGNERKGGGWDRLPRKRKRTKKHPDNDF